MTQKLILPREWQPEKNKVEKAHKLISKDAGKPKSRAYQLLFNGKPFVWTQEDHDQLEEVRNRRTPIKAPNGQIYTDYIDDGMNNAEDALDRILKDL